MYDKDYNLKLDKMLKRIHNGRATCHVFPPNFVMGIFLKRTSTSPDIPMIWIAFRGSRNKKQRENRNGYNSVE